MKQETTGSRMELEVNEVPPPDEQKLESWDLEADERSNVPFIGEIIDIGSEEYECTDLYWDRDEATLAVTYKKVTRTEGEKLLNQVQAAERQLADEQRRALAKERSLARHPSTGTVTSLNPAGPDRFA